jgi:hypothetical protein
METAVATETATATVTVTATATATVTAVARVVPMLAPTDAAATMARDMALQKQAHQGSAMAPKTARHLEKMARRRRVGIAHRSGPQREQTPKQDQVYPGGKRRPQLPRDGRTKVCTGAFAAYLAGK